MTWLDNQLESGICMDTTCENLFVPQRMCHDSELFLRAEQRSRPQQEPHWRIPLHVWQMRRVRGLLSLLFQAKWRTQHHPLTSPRFLNSSFLQPGKPAGHMTGYFHCKAARQEGEWKPCLSTVSLSAGPAARSSHCQQAQLGKALLWPIVRQELHMFTAVSFSPWCRGETGPGQRMHALSLLDSGRQKYLSAVESQHECTTWSKSWTVCVKIVQEESEPP